MAKAQISAEKLKETRDAGGKRMFAVKQNLPAGKAYGVAEAVKIIKERAKAKFDETIEVAVNLGVDPKHADQMVRGTVVLPHGLGKTKIVAVIASGDKVKDAEAAGVAKSVDFRKELGVPYSSLHTLGTRIDTARRFFRPVA